MGCGSCPKKQLKMRTQPEPISRELLLEMQSYIDHQVAVKDRIGITTVGTCVDVWVDDDQTGPMVEHGNIAVETFTGITMIGLNAVDSITLMDPATPNN